MTAIARQKNFLKQAIEKKEKQNLPRHIFVVHRHDSSTRHYVLRLEINGMLKCWAIPLGPSLNPHDRRMAIMIHDRPVSFISKGKYPHEEPYRGNVDVWDKGIFKPAGFSVEKDENKIMLRQLRNGNLTLILKGKILNGSFRLLRIQSKNENLWLLIKGNDGYAVDRNFDSEDYVPTSGRNGE